MLTRRRVINGALILGILATGAVILSALDDQYQVTEQVPANVPMLKGSVELARDAGQAITAAGEAAGGWALGDPVLTGRAEKRQAALYDSHPLLGKVAKTADEAKDIGGYAYSALADTLYPDTEAETKKLAAKAQIDRLNQDLTEKQKEALTLQAEIDTIKGQIADVEKTMNPLKGLIPGGFSFLGMDSPEPPSAPAATAGLTTLNSQQNSSLANQKSALEECSCPPLPSPPGAKN